MALNWFTKETRSFYIARPEEAAGELIYLHPDRSISRGTKLTVRSDECALFFREGRFVGRIDAGAVQLDTANFPFLGHLLIDHLTDANHFICEVFFVSLSETIIELPYESLGQYTDRNSANVVSILGSLKYTVRVADPVKLVVEAGGQSANSGSVVVEILNGRLKNQLRRVVGQRTREHTALDVVSNVDAEAISQQLFQSADGEFRSLGLGIGRIFDMVLSLDAASLELLRDFGRQESELRLQEKGARLATQDGFEDYNIIQGRRRALEGLGEGMANGNGPLLMTGGLGANLTGSSSSRAPSRMAPSRTGSVLASGSANFIIRMDGMETGPYTARQVALLAISKGLQLNQLAIRSTSDGPEMEFAADLEPQVVAEYRRRIPAGTSPPQSGIGSPATAPTASPTTASLSGTGSSAFDIAFAATLQDGVLTGTELDMLANLAVTLGLDPDLNTAKARVFLLLGGKNIQLDLKN